MECPRCNGDTTVIDSRPSQNNEVRRRRQCVLCKYRFTTYELTAVSKAILEQKCRKNNMEI